jgi:hypothetical protein
MRKTPPPPPDMLEVIDEALTAALREVRRARARAPFPAVPLGRGRGGSSNVKTCHDVLAEAGRPLHVSALLDALAQLGVSTSRDALASALAKRLAPRGPFVRTAPNTFGLAARDQR